MEGKVDYGEYTDKNNVRRQATTIIAGKTLRRIAFSFFFFFSALYLKSWAVSTDADENVRPLTRSPQHSLWACYKFLHFSLPLENYTCTHSFASPQILEFPVGLTKRVLIIWT